MEGFFLLSSFRKGKNVNGSSFFVPIQDSQLDLCLDNSLGNLSQSPMVWGDIRQAPSLFYHLMVKISIAQRGREEICNLSLLGHWYYFPQCGVHILVCFRVCVSWCECHGRSSYGHEQGRSLSGAFRICEDRAMVDLKRNTKCEIWGWEI